MKNKFNQASNLNMRLIIIFLGMLIAYALLFAKLYDLQIIKGEFLQNQVTGTTLKTISVSAQRGNIYDRYGNPLAVNNSSYTINLDPGVDADVKNNELNSLILKTINLLLSNNEDILDEFPIIVNKDNLFFDFTSDNKEIRWKKDMNLNSSTMSNQDILGLSPEECFNKLKSNFGIDETLSNIDSRKILSVRSELYKKRYSKFIPVTLAYNISQETIGAIEENKSDYPGVYVDVEALREYPFGKYFSHILGYIRGITEDELSVYKNYGYDQNDIVGKDGIEKAFELSLNGTDGSTYVEVDNLGRRINTVEENSIEPIAGNNVFLTLDSNLQKKVYSILESTLKDVIINRLTSKSKYFPFTLKQMLISMVNSNNISIEKILNSTEDTPVQLKLKNYIISKDKTALENISVAKQILSAGIDNSSVASRDVVITMHEQGIITLTENELTKLKKNSISPIQIIINKLESGEITPQMTAMDPSTGSVIITDVNTGDVISSVTYPSYDNNMLVNKFNNDYYKKLQNDPTTPLVNRTFNEPRAPGSTFKMVTAIAGLEEGIINPKSKIYDKGTFTDAGLPHAKCWIGRGKGSHGSVGIEHALEVSCNYFFYDLAYRMGNSKLGSTLKGIKTLNKYMEDFGLNDKTGVEIYELYDSTKNYPSNISSPEYKKYIFNLRNPNVAENEAKWYDGDTIRTAIGQSNNNYTAASLTKYISTIANKGKRYSLHFLDKISSASNDVIEEYTPNLEKELNIKEENLKAVHNGMLKVTSGTKGTLRGVFKNFKIKVAAKSGTAQQSSKRSEHTIFVGFAPYDNPQIAITVLIPFGNDGTTNPAPNIAKKVIEEYFGLNAVPEKETFNILSQY